MGVGRVDGRFRAADLFGKSFGVFGRHFVVFTTLAAVVLSPFYLVLLAAVLLRPDRNLGYVVVNLTVMLMLVIAQRSQMVR